MNKTTIIIGVLFVAFLVIGVILSIPNNKPEEQLAHAAPTNAIYHWRTTFDPSEEELALLQEQGITRIYMHMFDVDRVFDISSDSYSLEPIATTVFNAPIPEGMEVIPTVFITYESLPMINRRESIYAELIVERVKAMMSYNNLGPLREVQLDCDWTVKTRETYFTLCHKVREMLKADNIDLSVTVRLHQLNEEAPDVDRGVLMLYNTGSIVNANTKNSILDINDVRPYLNRAQKYPIPLDYAYPTYGWGVKFSGDKYMGIVSNPDEQSLATGETIRYERPSVATILEVKSLVERCLGKPYRNNIIYHLDEKQLKNYTNDEIAQILAHN